MKYNREIPPLVLIHGDAITQNKLFGNGILAMCLHWVVIDDPR